MCRALKPACQPDRIIVAGSLRRGRRDVGDVEIVYISKVETIPDGLFEVVQKPVVDTVLSRMLAERVIEMRQNKNGGTAWGQYNKLARHMESGIPVDLFAARPANWFSYLVCRTGSAENNIRIAGAARARGWKWHPYGEGFTDSKGLLVPVESEQDVFEKVGLKYREPKDR